MLGVGSADLGAEGSGCRAGGGRGRGGRGAWRGAGGGVPPLARGGGSHRARPAAFPGGCSWRGPGPRDATHGAPPRASAQPRRSHPPSSLRHAPPHGGARVDAGRVAAASESSCCAWERAAPSVARGEEPRAAREEPASRPATRAGRPHPPPGSLLAQPRGPRPGLPRVGRAGRGGWQEGAGVVRCAYAGAHASGERENEEGGV